METKNAFKLKEISEFPHEALYLLTFEKLSNCVCFLGSSKTLRKFQVTLKMICIDE